MIVLFNTHTHTHKLAQSSCNDPMITQRPILYILYNFTDEDLFLSSCSAPAVRASFSPVVHVCRLCRHATTTTATSQSLPGSQDKDRTSWSV